MLPKRPIGDQRFIIDSAAWGVLRTYNNMRDLEREYGLRVTVPESKPWSLAYGHKPLDQKAYQWDLDKEKWVQVLYEQR